MDGHRDLIAGVGDQVQPVAEPALDLRPLFAGARIDPRRLVFAPVGIRIGGRAGFPIDLPRAVAVDGLAVEA